MGHTFLFQETDEFNDLYNTAGSKECTMQPTEAQTMFMTTRFKPTVHSWEEVIEEAPSMEANSDIDSLADCAWPDKMPYNTHGSEVVCSLAEALANKPQADLRERTRGAAACHVRVAETHHRRLFLASPGSTILVIYYLFTLVRSVEPKLL